MHIKKRLVLLALLLFFTLPCIGWTADVTLSWDPSIDSNIVSYRLYAREEGEVYDYAHPQWEGSATRCTLSGFDEYESYFLVVRAMDADGHESGDSNEVYWSPNGNVNNSLSGDSGGGSGGGGCFISSLAAD